MKAAFPMTSYQLVRALETYRLISDQLADNWNLYMKAHDNRAKVVAPEHKPEQVSGLAYFNPSVGRVRLDYGYQNLINLQAIAKGVILSSFPVGKEVWNIDLYTVYRYDNLEVQLGRNIPTNRRYAVIYDLIVNEKGDAPTRDEFYWVNSLSYWRKPYRTIREVICDVLSLSKS